MTRKLAALRRLSTRQWLLLIESTLFLMVAAAVIAFLPFLFAARQASGRVRRPLRDPDSQRVREIGRIIEAVARRLPFRAKCFESGLAAQWMLRRRGIAATLFYGASLKPDGALSAHVWVRAGEIDVVGCTNASDFAVLARFPEPDQPAAPSSGSKRPPLIR